VELAYRDEVRRLLRDRLATSWGQPARRERIRAMVAGRPMWDEWDRHFKDGFGDLAQAVNYLTSHDVEKEGEQRLMNFVFGELLRRLSLGNGDVQQVRRVVDGMAEQEPRIQAAHVQALDQVRSGFGLLLTSVGIPMFLGGEEFADVHDLDHTDWRLKMSDPIDHRRRDHPGHRALWDAVQDLVHLRTGHPALQRNEVDFFYFHPQIDDNAGVRVFAYCRTAGRPVGSEGQVVVVANCGPQDFPTFDLPWPWTNTGRISEHGVPLQGTRPQFRIHQTSATVSLTQFQVRVFTT
jgi:1,4-alpha-glucan branching enzyme